MQISDVTLSLNEEDSSPEFYIAMIDGQKMCVSHSTGNRHCRAILEWLEEDGNELTNTIQQ